MNKYDKLFKELQINGYIENENIATQVLEEFYREIGEIPLFFQKIDQVTKIFNLMAIEKYQTALMPILEKYGYNYHAELQFFIVNACIGNLLEKFSILPSVKGYQKVKTGFILESIYGKVGVNKVTSCFQGIENYILYGDCHNTCREFIENFNNVSASTALIDRPFGEKKHYHSFINYGDFIIDLAHGAYMAKEEYNIIFNPIVLNTIYGYELEEEKRRIDSIESLNQDKSLLLRLALDKQLK